MGDKTGIAWCDHTFNRWWGCTKWTSACKFCYADVLARRTGKIPEGYKKGSARILSKSHNLSMLKKWDKLAEKNGVMSKVFCHSMSDIFDDEVPDSWREEEFEWMTQTSNLWFLLLTKRSKNPELFLQKYPKFERFFEERVWLGTSVGGDEDLQMAWDIVHCPARLHWVSYEPAISSLNVRQLPYQIKWLVVGGESGSNRPFTLEWLDAIISGISFNRFMKYKDNDMKLFVKQFGKNATLSGEKYDTPSDKSHGSVPEDWPERFRIREFPL